MHAPVLFGGGIYFLNDLTHISFPWRVLSAEQLQRGMMPLWNPYSYFGLPLLGNMQTGVLHPFGAVFNFFSYATALGWFLWLQQIMGAGFAYLWLRSKRMTRAGATAGAAVLSLGGFAVAYLQFPNMIGVVLHAPMLLLFAGRPLLFGLAAAIAFFAGYPPYWGFVIPMTWALGKKTNWKGLGIAVALSTVLWLPGAELAKVSGRGEQGLGQSERTRQSLRPYQLLGLIHPEAARQWDFKQQTPRPYRQQVRWQSPTGLKTFTFESTYVEHMKDPSGIRYAAHRTFYIGVLGTLLAVLGFYRAARREKALYAILILGTGVLVLGRHWGPSNALWSSFPPLGYIRGPARLSFLFTLAAMPLIALGIKTMKGKAAWLLAGLVVVELTVYGVGFYPTVPKKDYVEKGKLVEFLEKFPGERYFQDPSMEVWAHLDQQSDDPEFAEFRAQVYKTYKQKLFGISNAVYHLYDGNGAFEPLVPSVTQRIIKTLQSVPLQERAEAMKNHGIRRWLSRVRQEGDGLTQEGLTLWHSASIDGEKGTKTPWVPGKSTFYVGVLISLVSFFVFLTAAWRKRPRKGYTIA
ncbi:MAG: hypothetical protein COB53_11605 [Elusimicrobia bacterium]|nr:MAG: hypothetical protein COB53_11605 [Elusimicrobiota bacterium]